MRRRWTVLTLAAVALVAGATLIVGVSTRQPSSAPSPAPSVLRTGTDVLSREDARTLESDLSSGDSRRIRAALAVPAGQQLDGKFYAELATLGQFTVREGSAVQFDDTSARVYAEVEHGRVRTWTLLLSKEMGRWLVASTIEGEQQ